MSAVIDLTGRVFVVEAPAHLMRAHRAIALAEPGRHTKNGWAGTRWVDDLRYNAALGDRDPRPDLRFLRSVGPSSARRRRRPEKCGGRCCNTGRRVSVHT